jgi:hypothetical protein
MERNHYRRIEKNNESSVQVFVDASDYWMHETNSSKSIEHFLKPKGSVIADTIEMLDFIKNCILTI